MKTIKPILLIVSIVLLSGCVTQRKCNSKFPPSVQRDSSYIETLVPVPYYIPGDTAEINVPINCPDQNVVNFENEKLKQDIKILNGRLISRTIIQPVKVILQVKNTYTGIREVKIPEPVKYIPKKYQDAMWLCGIIFSGAFLFFGWKAYKFFKK